MSLPLSQVASPGFIIEPEVEAVAGLRPVLYAATNVALARPCPIHRLLTPTFQRPLSRD